MARGINAFRTQAKVANDRRSSGFANLLLMKEGESVVGRFRGMFVPPPFVYAKTDLEAMDGESLAAISWTLGLGSYEKTDEWVAAILSRYNQVEPFVYGEHYCKRTGGRDAYTTCGESFEPRLQCVGCVAKRRGDRGISQSDKAAFSFLPNRMYHSWESTGTAKKGFAYCEGDGCRLCAGNHVPKWDGMKYLALAMMHAEGVLAAQARVQNRCASCSGMGKIKLVGYVCPYCQNPLKIARNEEGQIPRFDCPSCAVKMQPVESVSCDRGCEAPRRCQLFDVDVLVQRLTGGTKTVYSFVEQFPCEPLTNERLLLRLPSFESALKPPPVEEQCARYGLLQNPFTGQAVTAAAPPASSYEEEGDVEGPPIEDGDDSGPVY